MELCIKNKESLELVFPGSSSINIEDLSIFLNKTADIFREIVVLNEKDIPLQLTVDAFEKRSFKIIISAILGFTPKLFSKIKDVKEVVGAFREIIEIKDMLKGQNPKEVFKNKIVAPDDKEYKTNNQLVLHIYGNENNINVLDNAIVNFNHSIPKGRNLKILDKKGSFEISEKIKENLSKKAEIEEEYFENENLEKRTLIIKKPDLTLKSKWEFIIDKVIKANILDEEFKEKVINKEFYVFHNKKINVLLRTKIKLDKNSEVVETHYEVEKVFESTQDGML